MSTILQNRFDRPNAGSFELMWKFLTSSLWTQRRKAILPLSVRTHLPFLESTCPLKTISTNKGKSADIQAHLSNP
jgi:hypothetical protein